MGLSLPAVPVHAGNAVRPPHPDHAGVPVLGVSVPTILLDPDGARPVAPSAPTTGTRLPTLFTRQP